MFTVFAATDDYVTAGGVSRERLIGAGIFESFPDNPDNAGSGGMGTVIGSFRRVLKTGSEDRVPLVRYDVARPDGAFEERYFAMSNRPVLGNDGSVGYIIHSAEEITERVMAERRERRAEQELRSSEVRFRQLAEASTVGIIIAPLEGEFTYLNPAMRMMLGYTESDLSAGMVRRSQMTPEEFASLDRDAIRQLADTGRCAPYEKVYLGKGGRRVPVLVAAYVLDPAQERKEVVAFIVDLTLRKRSDRDAFLVQLERELRSIADPDQIMRTAARLLADHLQVDRCVYGRVAGKARKVELTVDFVRSGSQPAAGTGDLSQFGPEASRRMLRNVPYVVNHLKTDPHGALAAIAVPLHKDGALAAAMAVQQEAPRVWLAHEVELVKSVADRCWESHERASAVRECQQSEDRLRLAQRAAAIGTFEWFMKEGRIIWTPELEMLYGLPEGTFEGTFEGWARRLVPEDAERVTASIARCTAEHEHECVYDFRILQPGGSTRWLRGRAHFSYDAQGEPERMVGVNIDIDAQKRAELDLRNQWETFDSALSNTPDFIYIINPDGRLRYGNRALLALWHLTLDEAKGKNFFELPYPEELARTIHNQIQQVVNTKRPIESQTRYIRADGQARHYHYIFSPVFDHDGQVEAVAGTGRDITENVMAEQLIQEDRRRWRDVLYRAPAAVALLRGPEHRFEWVNDRYRELADRPPAELTGRAATDSLPNPEVLDIVYRTGESFVGHEAPLSVKRRDDAEVREMYVNFVYAPTRDSNGVIDGIFVHITDVTDGLAARRRAEDSEQKLRTLMDSARDHAIISLDLDGRVTTWNAGAERLLGYGEAEIVGQSGAIIFTAEDIARGAPEEELASARTSGHATDERWHVRKDGSRFWGSGTLTAMYGPSGEVAAYVKVFQDRTTERVAKNRLRESEESFRQLADSMPQMVWTAAPDGRVDYFNMRWYDFTGFGTSHNDDEVWERVLHPEDKGTRYRAWELAVRTGEPYHIEYRLWDRHEGRWRWFMERAIPVRDSAGYVAKWFGTSTDIDEQKIAQQAVLQAQKLESIGLLAGGIAHDFNNLLVGIMGGASFALDTIPPAHPAYDMLQGVVDASERAAHLTRQMLAYAGKGRFVIEPVNLSEMASRTAELVSASIPKSVRVEFHLDQRLPPVHMDPGQMQQVAMNLIINAAEAIGEDVSTGSRGGADEGRKRRH